MAEQNWSKIITQLVRGIGDVLRSSKSSQDNGSSGSKSGTKRKSDRANKSGNAQRSGGSRQGGGIGRGKNSDYSGKVTITYEPHPDGDADPGEVVWTWVAYEDDPSQGKDRPVLIIARQKGNVLGLMMSSQDHAPKESIRREGSRVWMDLGTGPWDSKGRPSDIRLDRVLVLDPNAIRREGAVLDEIRFEKVADAVKKLKGW